MTKKAGFGKKRDKKTGKKGRKNEVSGKGGVRSGVQQEKGVKKTRKKGRKSEILERLRLPRMYLRVAADEFLKN